MNKPTEVVVQNLACKLTPGERESKTAELVRLEQDEAAQKAAKKNKVAEMNAGLKLVRADIEARVKELADGEETREVEVETRFDYDAKRVRYVRRDTGDEIDSREMDSYDLQENLPDPDLHPPPQKPKPRKPRKKHGQLTDVDAT